MLLGGHCRWRSRGRSRRYASWPCMDAAAGGWVAGQWAGEETQSRGDTHHIVSNRGGELSSRWRVLQLTTSRASAGGWPFPLYKVAITACSCQFGHLLVFVFVWCERSHGSHMKAVRLPCPIHHVHLEAVPYCILPRLHIKALADFFLVSISYVGA